MSAASTLFAFVLFANADTPAPGEPAACPAERYRQFRLWKGDWSGTQSGKPVGKKHGLRR